MGRSRGGEEPETERDGREWRFKNTIVHLSNICMCPVGSKMFVRVGNILLLMYARNLKINKYFFLFYSYAYFNSELVASLARS